MVLKMDLNFRKRNYVNRNSNKFSSTFTYLDVQIAFGQYFVLATFLELAVQHDLPHFEVRVGHILSFRQQRLVRHFQLNLGLFLFQKLPVARLDHVDGRWFLILLVTRYFPKQDHRSRDLRRRVVRATRYLQYDDNGARHEAAQCARPADERLASVANRPGEPATCHRSAGRSIRQRTPTRHRSHCAEPDA